MGRALRIVFSLVIGIIPLLYLGGYLAFIPGLPSPASLLGSFGLTGQNGFFNITGGGAGTLVPFGTMGLSGLIVYQLLSRVGGAVSSATMASTRPSPDEMMRRMNISGMTGGMIGAQPGVPETLPPDLTKSQYVILRSYRQGYKNPKEIGKALSMDKKEVETQTSSLVKNGYLTNDNKLTAKALDHLGA